MYSLLLVLGLRACTYGMRYLDTENDMTAIELTDGRLNIEKELKGNEESK